MRDRILAYLLVCGRTSLGAEQYEYVRSLVAGERGVDETNAMHPYKTIRRQMRTKLASWCFPGSNVKFVEKVERPRGLQQTKMVKTDTDLRKSAQACVHLVLPSEWAKLDLCTYTFYSDVYEHPQRDSTEFLTIETSPFVQERGAFIGKNPVFWSLFSGAP